MMSNKLQTKFLFVFLLLGVFLCFTQPAGAATFNFDTTFSDGATPPDGSAPWLTATFQDIPGGVMLTMSASGLTDPEKIQEWYFNVGDEFIGELNFEYVGGVEASRPVQQRRDAFRAGNDGRYDILFTFDVAEKNKFGPGGTVTSVYTISAPGLTADSFNLLSTPQGDAGPYLSAARVLSTGEDNEGSAWVGAVPIPSSALLLAPALFLLAVVRRKCKS